MCLFKKHLIPYMQPLYGIKFFLACIPTLPTPLEIPLCLLRSPAYWNSTMTVQELVTGKYESSGFYSLLLGMPCGWKHTGNAIPVSMCNVCPFWNKSFILPCLPGAKRKHGKLIYQQRALLFVSTMKAGLLYYGQL